MNPQMALKFEGVGAGVGTVGALVWPFTCQDQVTVINNGSPPFIHSDKKG
jgi:hypothetical protein